MAVLLVRIVVFQKRFFKFFYFSILIQFNIVFGKCHMVSGRQQVIDAGNGNADFMLSNVFRFFKEIQQPKIDLYALESYALELKELTFLSGML